MAGLNQYGKLNLFDALSLKAQSPAKFFESNSTHSISMSAPSTLAADLTLVLPATAGTSGQVLSTNGSAGVLSWVSALSTSLASGSIFVGVSGTATAVDTAAQGEITASASGLTINAGVILNEDINASAGIVYSKLSLTNSIVNADIATSAAIALSKLAALTASRALASDGSGVISASATTSTELGYVSGVTSAIQTQLDSKARGFAADWVNADGATKAITHNLASNDIIVQIWDVATEELIAIDSTVKTSTNVLTLTASQAPGTTWRVVIIRV